MVGVDEYGLTSAGIDAVIRLPNNTMHLLAGLDADQYAAEMRGQLALPLAA
jgi:PTS system glucose-specific IIC component